jgi:hypothetical protein
MEQVQPFHRWAMGLIYMEGRVAYLMLGQGVCRVGGCKGRESVLLQLSDMPSCSAPHCCRAVRTSVVDGMLFCRC